MPTVDLLVIGGGIHGACVARDAALRGLSVVLAEKDDLASGTSSRSSKLAHGGIRYLETRQFALVRESLHERAVLLRTAPGLVRAVHFLLPFYEEDARPAWFVRLGLSLYDTLAGQEDLPKHRMHTPAEALALEPALPRAGLTGAAEFSDAQMDDAGLVVANAVAAARAGAVIRTRTLVTALEPARAGARPSWRATLAGGEMIEARAVVNAAGPWIDAVRGSARAGASARPTLRRTRGTHIVVPQLTKHPLLLFARKDRRVFFVLPWLTNWSLVGTTDTDDDRPPDEVSPTAADVRYLWDELRARWPDAPDPAGVTARVFAGLRPLARTRSRRAWDNPREARLVMERGLLSMVGGKFTTARHLAELAVDRVVHDLGMKVARCTTASALLPGRSDDEHLAPLARWKNRPGESTGTPIDLARGRVELAMEHQFARHVGDVIFRRSMLWLDAASARAAAPAVAGWMGERLGWSEAERAAEVAEVLAVLDAEGAVIAEAAGG
jgi:glycerol-3-phosphate dehydrogenase